MRKNAYNLYGTPTVYFDGGYSLVLGAGSTASAKTAYTNKINAAGLRTVDDVDVDMSVHWLGNATMDISVTVTNHDPKDYTGTLRVNICELVSSLNWKDSANKLYTYPLLEDESHTLNIAPGASDTFAFTWDGTTHNSGFGQSYANIQVDNIEIIAEVINDEWHQGYSNPPTGRPFDAYYHDEVAGKVPDTLWSDVAAVPEAGGTVNFTLSADEDNMNRNYLLIGGASGTSPGTLLPGSGRLYLPINMDWFTDIEWVLLNTANFANFLGTLDANGQAFPQLVVPPVPGAAGLILYFSATCNNPFDYVSNVVEIEIVP